MREEYSYSVSFFQRKRAWLLLPVGGYVAAIPLIGAFAFHVPGVLKWAPVGILMWLEVCGIKMRDPGFMRYSLHFVFWSLCLIGLLAREKLPLIWLKRIWFFLAIMLVMSISGCAVTFGPGMRSMGAWG